MDTFVAHRALHPVIKPIGLDALRLVVATTILAGVPCTCRADIYITDIDDLSISKYTDSGNIINSPLVAGLDRPRGIAVTGGEIYVTNNSFYNTIGKYTTSGATINPTLISSLYNPLSVAISGSTLYAWSDFSTIGAYDAATGAVINPALITGLSGATGIAVDGPFIYVGSLNRVGKYTLAGAPVNPALVTGLNNSYGVAADGGFLYVTDTDVGRVGKYDANTGAPINSALITGLARPYGIAVSGSELYVASANELTPGKDGSIGRYTTTGVPLNPALISDITPFGVALSGDASVPPVSPLGDFDHDFDVDVADYLILSTHLLTDVSGLGSDQSYLLGDITKDQTIDGNDFSSFVAAFDAANGIGSFAAAQIAVPEPSMAVLIAVACVAWRRRRC